jgi:hypothetical protein
MFSIFFNCNNGCFKILILTYNFISIFIIDKVLIDKNMLSDYEIYDDESNLY